MQRQPRHDRGSAPVEFVLVAPLVILIFTAIVQVALAAYVRATLVASAAEGARAGAEYGADRSAAARRTRAALEASIADGVVEEVTVSERREDGMQVVAVQIRARLPLFGLYGPSALVVSGRALKEGAS